MANENWMRTHLGVRFTQVKGEAMYWAANGRTGMVGRLPMAAKVHTIAVRLRVELDHVENQPEPFDAEFLEQVCNDVEYVSTWMDNFVFAAGERFKLPEALGPRCKLVEPCDDWADRCNLCELSRAKASSALENEFCAKCGAQSMNLFVKLLDEPISEGAEEPEAAAPVVREVVEADGIERTASVAMQFGPDKMALDLIDPSPYQPEGRGVAGTDAELEELAASIRAEGVIEPVVLRAKADGRYELVAGHRRVAASRLAGLSAVPYVLRELTDDEARRLTAVENVQRKALSPLEESVSVGQMLAAGDTPEKIAASFGKSVRWVYRRASLSELSAWWLGTAQRASLSAVFLEHAARLPKAMQDEAAKRLEAEYQQEAFARGGDVAALDAVVGELSRTLESAPWWKTRSALCAGCVNRSDGHPELFASDEPARCLDGACWERRLGEWTAAVAKKLRAEGPMIEAKGKDAYLFAEKRDAAHPVPVLVTEGVGKGTVRWAPSREQAAAADKPKKAKGPSKADWENFAAAMGLRAAVNDAHGPQWLMSGAAANIAPQAMMSLACGLGVDEQAAVPGPFPNPLERALAVFDTTTTDNQAQIVWRVVRGPLMEALRLDPDEFDAAEWARVGTAARALAELMDLPEELYATYRAGAAAGRKGRK